MTNNILETEEINLLFELIASCKNKKELEHFLRDVIAYQELIQIAKRIKSAQLINEGLPYREVTKRVGISITTVTRIGQALKYSQTNGCKNILNRLGKTKKS